MALARVELPEKLIPVFDGPADVRWSCGGRGSAKTRSFAKMAAVRGYIYGNGGVSGQILCARQFMNSLDDSSLEECKRAIEDEPWLAEYYEIGDKFIKSRDGRIWFSFAGLDRNIASIKSKGRILLCWVDEAEPVTDGAWSTLIPTLREEGDGWNAELWVTWNPRRKIAPVESRFFAANDPLIKGAVLNWRDNPKFPAKLERDRQRDLAERPDSYGHVWEGEYESVVEGAYWASDLTKAKAEGRIGFYPADPLMTIRLYADIGGTGARADAFAFWAAQFIGGEIRVIDHYEVQGQPIGAHLEWLRERGYTPGKAQIWLPHDGDTQDRVFDVSYKAAFEAAGYAVTVIPNQGKGAAKQRIEAVRRRFPSIRFNEQTTEAGRAALGWYHEKRDEVRGVGLGPDHDWASHCFTGDTLVQTHQGIMRFDKLPQTGLVLTPCGLKPYRNPRITLVNAPLVEVRFSDGHTVRCTPDHLFATGSGWKSAQSLERGSLILSTSTLSRSILTAVCIGLGLTKSTLAEVARDFIVRFGRMLLVKSQKVAISTTGTGIRSITKSTTLNVWMPENTLASRGTQAKSQIKPSIFRPWRGIVPEIGTSQKREGFGTSVTQSEKSSGQKTSDLIALVLSAEKSFSGLIERQLQRRNTVRLHAKERRTGYLEKQTLMPLRIESVRHLNEKSDVWDLTVPGIECFALSNGAIVHNSADAFGLMCVAYEMPKENSAAPINYRRKYVA